MEYEIYNNKDNMHWIKKAQSATENGGEGGQESEMEDTMKEIRTFVLIWV